MLYKPEPRGDDLGRERSKKCGAVSTYGDHPSKTSWMGAWSDTRCLKNVPVPRRRIGENEDVKVEHLVRARDIKEGADFPLVWENPDLMEYIKLEAEKLDARKFGVFLSHRRASHIVYAGRFCFTVYGAWQLR